MTRKTRWWCQGHPSRERHATPITSGVILSLGANLTRWESHCSPAVEYLLFSPLHLSHQRVHHLSLGNPLTLDGRLSLSSVCVASVCFATVKRRTLTVANPGGLQGSGFPLLSRQIFFSCPFPLKTPNFMSAWWLYCTVSLLVYKYSICSCHSPWLDLGFPISWAQDF